MRRALSVGIAGLLLAVVAAGGARSAAAEPNLLLSYSIEYGGIRVMEVDARLDLANGTRSDYRSRFKVARSAFSAIEAHGLHGHR